MSLTQSTKTAGRQYCILGTAGHIDHGKSSLVKALTGTDPDRLPEEQARGMTIELGFAHLPLRTNTSERHVGIVDVPGHERFVRTMVAGATGIDIAMLVIAADDGVMPQTREHVDILDLLGIKSGLVALSKVDLVPSDRVQTVNDQITSLLAETSLRDWPIVPCSATTGIGLDEIRNTIALRMESLPLLGSGPIFRLAIDRVFAVHGRGTVVTGSVLCGNIIAGTALELLPGGISCKVREVQSHHASVNGAGSGQRAALNLTGIERDQIDRGMELATPGYLEPSRYVDAQVRILPRTSKSVTSHSRVRVGMATGEELAAFVVIGADELPPGTDGLVQLRFQSPVVCSYGQRFILRNETAEITLGGGSVIRPVSRRLRPRDAEEAESLKQAASDDVATRFSEAQRQAAFAPIPDLRMACRIGCEPSAVSAIREKLRSSGTIVSISPAIEVHRAALDGLARRTSAFLMRHHTAHPSEPGMLRERLVTWLDGRTSPGVGKTVLARLETDGRIISRGPYVADKSFRPATSNEDSGLLEKIVAEVTAAKWDPPLWPALQALASLSRQRSQSLENAAKADGRLVMIAPQHYIAREPLEEFKALVRKLGTGRRFKLAEVRDETKLSRRAVQPLLEYLDRVGFTKRLGDERVLMEQAR